MPRYLVERSFAEGFALPGGPLATDFADILAANARDDVHWIHSYVSRDRRRLFCLYDGASPEAIRHAARANRLPVDSITEVSVLDPYAYLEVNR